MRKSRAIESQHGAELSRVGRNDTAKKCRGGPEREGVNRKTTGRWLSIDAREPLSRDLRARISRQMRAPSLLKFDTNGISKIVNRRVQLGAPKKLLYWLRYSIAQWYTVKELASDQFRGLPALIFIFNLTKL